MQQTVQQLRRHPSPQALQASREAWGSAKQAYSLTEAFRFGHWPMEEYDLRVNSWPVDEGLIDYIEEPYNAAPENPLGRANLVASDSFVMSGREINVQALSAGLVEGFHALSPVESAVLSGFHAVEFLLWGQDQQTEGPGQRPWTDYAMEAGQCTDGDQPAALRHCQRRSQLLQITTDLLAQDLTEMERLWSNDSGSYGSRLAHGEPTAGLRQILFAITSLATDELAGERLTVPLQSAGQEDEQDCFSDLTPISIAGNIAGVAAVFRGVYTDTQGKRVEVPALRDLIQRQTPQLANDLDNLLRQAEVLAQAIQAEAQGGLAFDQQITLAQPAARTRINTLITRLQDWGEGMLQAAEILDVGSLNPALQSSATSGGGETTVARLSPDVVLSPDALSQPAANLTPRERSRFAVGNSFFTSPWVAAPASTTLRDGLGPLFNAAACQNCHIRDGRGHAPLGPNDDFLSSVVRLGDQDGNPDPVYGTQIQDHTLAGFTAEARIALHWEQTVDQLQDGSRVAMRRPRLEFKTLGYGGLAAATHAGLRIAPPMTGLGLLELVPQADIQAQADPDDVNDDRISGRVRVLGGDTIGRFGWKAAKPSVRSQAASAFHQDMGLTTREHPQENCPSQADGCRSAAVGEEPEVSADILDAVSFYARHLAVPQRRWTRVKEVRAGEQTFQRIGCALCHRPQWTTRVSTEFPALSEQVIFPYTDLLLHDMGPGLADGVGEPDVSPSEWRTPPLWGLHLLKAVGGSQAGYLHDGRALTLEAAILWHGGEGKAAADAFRALPRTQREDLLWFLKSL